MNKRSTVHCSEGTADFSTKSLCQFWICGDFNSLRSFDFRCFLSPRRTFSKCLKAISIKLFYCGHVQPFFITRKYCLFLLSVCHSYEVKTFVRRLLLVEHAFAVRHKRLVGLLTGRNWCPGPFLFSTNVINVLMLNTVIKYSGSNREHNSYIKV